MPDRLTIACAQANPVVGDIAGNLGLARRARRKAAEAHADLVAFGELSICGFPPEDLVLRPSFVAACRDSVRDLARETADGGPAVLVGTPWAEGNRVYNAVCLLDGGEVAAVRHKVNLPLYGAFEQKRVFSEGELPGPIRFRGLGLGVPVGEDIWIDEIVECLQETGAEIILAPSASPWWRGKHDLRLNVAVARVTESGLPLLYVNQLGGQDELVFDGASFGLNGDRSLAFQMPAFAPGLAITRWARDGDGWRCVGGDIAAIPDEDELIWLACVTSLRDHVEKNGFREAVLRPREDAETAICAAVAADALGPGRVGTPAWAETSDAGAGAGMGRASLLLDVRSRTDLWLGRGAADGDFAPLRDLYATELRRLGARRNRIRPAGCLGPEGETIAAPLLQPDDAAEAEDDILRRLVDQRMSVAEAARQGGHAPETVRKVEDIVFRAEYKRRRGAPGPLVSGRDPGRARHYPATNRFRDPDPVREEDN